MDVPQGLSEYITTRLIPIRELSEKNQKSLLDKIVIETHPVGSYIFQQGDIDDHVYYLLAGKINMMATDQSSFIIDTDVEQALYPIGQMQPRQYSAQILKEAKILKFNKLFFNALIDADKAETCVIEESNEAETACDWMTQLLESRIFASIPPQNIQKIFELFEEVSCKRKDRVIEQGTEGDYFYIIKEGEFEVCRRLDKQNKTFRLAVLHSGDTFGEESLLGNMPRNATVTAVTDGTLMRITKESFINLIRDPAIRSVSYDEAMEMIGNGCVWLDVRRQQEFRSYALAGSLNVPLDTLRIQLQKLDVDKDYIVYCDNGSRSAVAAYLLISRGFAVNHLHGGIQNYQSQINMDGVRPAVQDKKPVENITPILSDSGVMEPFQLNGALHAGETMIKSLLSQQGDTDQLSKVLSVVLADIFRQLEQALKEKAEAEVAKSAAEQKLAEFQLRVKKSQAKPAYRRQLTAGFESDGPHSNGVIPH